LSETPQKPSVGWDAELPRIMSFAKLRDTQEENAGAPGLVFLNTHWDHIGARARVESARLMQSWLTENARDVPVIITGDFNDDAGAPSYRELVTGGLIDAFGELHPGVTSDQCGTYHGFTGKHHGQRIDWILCSR